MECSNELRVGHKGIPLEVDLSICKNSAQTKAGSSGFHFYPLVFSYWLPLTIGKGGPVGPSLLYVLF